MAITNKKIGIWGLGISGTSAYNYFKNTDNTVQILNKTDLNTNIVIVDTPENRKKFLEHNDIIIPSPGIDLDNYSHYEHKFVPEVDLFQEACNIPVIGITGTLGKTSITHYLTTLLNNAGITAHAAGNIGNSMLDLLDQQSCYAILELSSFQLEQSKKFKPDLAIWTNFHPNHLDRHKTEKQYFEAKTKILAHQTEQQALVPLNIAQHLKNHLHQNHSFFSLREPIQAELIPGQTVYHFDIQGNITKNKKILLPHHQVPLQSFKANWLIIAAAIDMLGYNPSTIIRNTEQIKLPGARLESIATIGGTTYYNDSKSTVMQATLAAVQQLKNQKIILLLGGISKGIDRTSTIAQLANKVAYIVCFGKEAKQLERLCKKYKIPTEAHSKLEQAFTAAQKQAHQKNCILFSPGGASFDLFKNYHERGEKFKALVEQFLQNS